MKKFAIFMFIVVLIVCGFFCSYLNYKNTYENSKKANLKFEEYLNKEITGNELTSVINMAIDSNERNNVEKDNKGIYIENDINSIKIEIKMIDNDNIYQMETIYKNGIQNFTQYYGDIKFKCVNKKYHKDTNRVKYILFEQITQ